MNRRRDVKKFIALVFGLLMIFGGWRQVRADGCYVCKEGGHVRYRGSDTFAKRREAKKKCNCTVTGTTSSCANPKCTVSVVEIPMMPLSNGKRWALRVNITHCTQP